MDLKIQGEEVWTRFIGDFNASNLLAVYAASELLGAKKEGDTDNSERSQSVPGRLEVCKFSGRNNRSLSIMLIPPMPF